MSTARLAPPAPPVARRQASSRLLHGAAREDPYAWLRQRDEPEVRAYLEAENAYTESVMEPLGKVRERLFEEMRGRLEETDSTVPVPDGDHFYYRRTEAGRQYPIYCRRSGSPEAPEEILLDLNELVSDGGFLALGAFAVSPDHRLLAYSVDLDGSERFALRILELASRRHIGAEISGTARGVAWANDSSTFFYLTLDSAHRPDRLYRGLVGGPVEDAVELHHEADERFFLGLFRTRSRAFVGLVGESRTTSEIRVIDADQPLSPPRLVLPRRAGVEAGLGHRGEHFYLLTNDEAVDFRLVRTPINDADRGAWEEVVAHRPGVRLEDFDLFRDHLVVYLREEGVRQIEVHDLRDGACHRVAFDEPIFTVAGEGNAELDTTTLRFTYTSPVTPPSTFDYDLESRERTLLKTQAVRGGFDAARYACESLRVAGAGGAEVPVSLVFRRDLRRDGSAPLLLYGYGSYGISIEPRFSSPRLSLLDRGFVYAIAHVRGGGELGRSWYDDGKLAAKENTFGDFIAVAEHLVAAGYTRPDRLAIRGGSAGGMLIGTVLNRRPELFAAALAEVPFVDVVNTMLDRSIPLTVIELEEWGDPELAEDFATIAAYSPYDNVGARDYPHLLVTAGLHDPRVQFWEPAKWVARLRARRTNDALLLLRTEMGSGHRGASGRYDALREEAFKLAFLLYALGIEAP